MISRPSAPPFVPALLLALAGIAASAQAAPASPGARAGDARPAELQDTAQRSVETAPESPPQGAAPDIEAGVPAPRAAKAVDARIEHLVTEDSQVRIEETRVRGVTRKIVVHSKIPGMGSYEIQPADPGLEPTQDHGAGMRLFNFDW